MKKQNKTKQNKTKQNDEFRAARLSRAFFHFNKFDWRPLRNKDVKWLNFKSSWGRPGHTTLKGHFFPYISNPIKPVKCVTS